MEAASKQQPGFSENSPGTVRKAPPSKLHSAGRYRPHQPSGLQMERRETGEPTAPPLAGQTGAGSWWKFRLVPGHGQGSPLWPADS